LPKRKNSTRERRGDLSLSYKMKYRQPKAKGEFSRDGHTNQTPVFQEGGDQNVAGKDEFTEGEERRSQPLHPDEISTNQGEGRVLVSSFHR